MLFTIVESIVLWLLTCQSVAFQYMHVTVLVFQLKDLKRQLHAERKRAEKLQERLQEVLSDSKNKSEDVHQNFVSDSVLTAFSFSVTVVSNMDF